MLAAMLSRFLGEGRKGRDWELGGLSRSPKCSQESRSLSFSKAALFQKV